MEDQSQYNTYAKFEGKTELFRIYYNPREITFNLFLWLEEATMKDAFVTGCKQFKAYPSDSIGTFIVCKN